LSWSCLTGGVALGSLGHNELGWGGWWFWDPVENASLHAVADRRALPPRWW
jgi:cytochrome c biogenesis factor